MDCHHFRIFSPFKICISHIFPRLFPYLPRSPLDSDSRIRGAQGDGDGVGCQPSSRTREAAGEGETQEEVRNVGWIWFVYVIVYG